MPGAPMSIFISYSRRNSSFVDQLEAHLKACNFNTQVDRRKFEENQPWKKVLKDAIDQCDLVLVVLSPASITSPYVQMEYKYALSIDKCVILLEHQPCPDIPVALRDIQRVSFGTNTERGLRDLLIVLNLGEMEPSDRINYFRKHAILAQNAKKWRQAAGFWQALLAMNPQRSEARQYLEQCLRIQGKRASASGEWEKAISMWEALLKLRPGDAQATRQLSLAQYNLGYAQYYKDAQQFIEENAPSPARTQLSFLWEYAPYYGDPEGLALKAGITKPLRSPATLDKEEEDRLAKEQQEREAQEAREREERARKQREREALEAQEREWRAEEQRRREGQEARERERLLREQQEREAEQARERARHPLPVWFIEHELGTTRFIVWCSLFCLLAGLGGAIGIVTQSIPQTLGAIVITALLAYLFGYHRTVHRMPKRLQHRVEQNSWEYSSHLLREDDSNSILYVIAPLVIVVICSFIALFVVIYVSPLRYNTPLVSHFLWFSHSSWLGRQIDAGLLIGSTLSLITFFSSWSKPQKLGLALGRALTSGVFWGFVCLLICLLFGALFDWGFGFGSGWSFSLLGLAVGAIGGAGLGSLFVICMKDKPLI